MAALSDRAEVWAVAGVAGPLDVRIFVRGVTAYAHTVGLVPVRIVTGGVPLSEIVIQNLSTSPIDLGNDQRLTWGQGLRVPARAQWSVAGISPIGDIYGDTRTSLTFFYTGVLAPHAATTRWTYTVPTGRRARVETATVYVEVVTVAAAGSLTLWTYIGVFPGGGAGTVVAMALIYVDNLAGTRSGTALAASIELQPGDVLSAVTENLRAGGTSIHMAEAKITEANA